MSQQDFKQEVLKESQKLRKQSFDNYSKKNIDEANKDVNDAAALEQANEILVLEKEDIVNRRNKSGNNEGQSVTYHLPSS